MGDKILCQQTNKPRQMSSGFEMVVFGENQEETLKPFFYCERLRCRPLGSDGNVKEQVT